VITKLNLATHPFRNRNFPYLLALFLLAISVGAALLEFSTLRNNNRENDIATAQIQELEAEISQLNGDGKKIQQQLAPDQQNLLIAAHKLVANKTFVWSRLFSDLESVLPDNVSASRIVVRNVYNDGNQIKADLEFAVLSWDYSSVSNMIDSMNNSGLFQAELRGQDLQKSNHATYTEYTLRLIYSPTRSLSTEPTTDVAQNNSGGAQ
jgi:Tfp pilus assembly protein PilN